MESRHRNMKTIGIVCNGFVGSSVAFGCSPQTGCDADVKIYDKDETKSTHSLSETLESDFIFVSVPTPSNKDGSINLDIVYDCFHEMSMLNKRKDNVILLRSTVVPGTTQGLQDKFPSLNIVFNPEFLTERSAKFDFINQSRFILGGKKMDVEKVADLYSWRFGKTTPVIKTNYETSNIINGIEKGLSESLRKKYGKKSARVVEGDSVKVIRGEFTGVDGKVTKVSAANNGLTIEGVKKEKLKGEKYDVFIHTSNIEITGLNTDDKWRINKLEGKNVRSARPEYVKVEPKTEKEKQTT